MSRLNYHHLNYFWNVAKIGNLTKTAEILHVSQSALSSQIKQLENNIGSQLFTREKRRLKLTNIGQVTFSYAESIFNLGNELEGILNKGYHVENQVIKIGILSTMSRNFVEAFVKPLMNNPKIKLVIVARGQINLLNELSNYELDLILTNIEVRGSAKQSWQGQLLSKQPTCVIGHPGLNLGKHFNQDYSNVDWILPLSGNPIRSAFDGLCAQHEFQPNIIGEADDMAMLRLLARDTHAVAVMPSVVVKDEIASGNLTVYTTLPNINENFYIVTVKKHKFNQMISELVRDFNQLEINEE
ncbi:MAG: LysR family transcriptional activator of nhaA [Methylophilaceae bacterium]|jgi:LysR family transcriptional activator of nhaA